MAGRALVAVVLLALFPFIVVALGVGGVLGGITVGGSGGFQLALLSVGMMGALGFALVQAVRVRLEPPDGPRLTRQEQPVLWQLVDELAARAHTWPPDEIVLVPEINAAVNEDARMLGLRPGRRFMMIGLPLLAGLTVAELRSVLAHELGHYGGGHTRLLAVSYRGAETLSRTLARLDGGPARWVINAYAKLYMVISRSANRNQELQADAYSVAAVGRSTAAAALRKIATMDVLLDVFERRYLKLPALAERTPDILLGFRNFLDHPKQRQMVAEIEPRVIESEPSSAFDSHPPIRRRIEEIGRLPDNPAPPDDRPGWAVLLNPATVIPSAEAAFYLKGARAPRASWEEIAALGAQADAARGAEVLAEAARKSGAAPSATIGEILHVLQRGGAERLVGPMLPDDMPPGDRQEAIQNGLTEILGDTIISALVAQGRVRFQLDWGTGWRVFTPAGELRTAELVGPAVANPAQVPRLIEHLRTLGVPPSFVAPPTDRSARRPADDGQPQIVDVAPEVGGFRRTWDAFVLVNPFGLLLVPIKAGAFLSLTLAGVLGQAGSARRKRVGGLLKLGPEGLRALPGVKWLPREGIEGGWRRGFVTGGGKIVMTFSDGTEGSLRTQDGDSYQTLATFVDPDAE